ncbi:MAG: flagellar basal-body MS-ring/collar protein FliF [Parvularculaceae bacterium]
MNEFVKQLQSIGVGRLVAAISAGLGVLLALVLLVGRANAPELGVLYAGLDYADAQAAIERLDRDGAVYELRERDGAMTILAPRADLARLKLALAGDGLVLGRGVGYELFDDDDVFGSTRFQQDLNRLRALEGELARTISSLTAVRSARVHLVLPERALFARDRTKPSASVVVDAPGGLGASETKAIVNLVASAAPALAPGDVTLLDLEGALLAGGGEEADGAAAGARAAEMRAEAEARVRRTVEGILAPIVGPENFRVEVAAELELARVVESAEIIDPDSQSILSSTFIEENANAAEPALAGTVSVANALPGAEAPGEDGPTATSANTRTEETTNYEFTRRTRNEVREMGGVKRLSVAVAIAERADAAGPRPAAQLDRLQALVRAAVGFDAARGDQVDVTEVAFAEAPAPTPADASTPASIADAPRDLTRYVEPIALALVALALIVFIVRPVVLNALAGAGRGAQRRGAPNELEASAASPTQIGTQVGTQIGDATPQIDLERLDGDVRGTTLRQVAEVDKNHTDESAAILKGWIREAS